MQKYILYRLSKRYYFSLLPYSLNKLWPLATDDRFFSIRIQNQSISTYFMSAFIGTEKVKNCKCKVNETACTRCLYIFVLNIKVRIRSNIKNKFQAKQHQCLNLNVCNNNNNCLCNVYARTVLCIYARAVCRRRRKLTSRRCAGAVKTIRLYAAYSHFNYIL